MSGALHGGGGQLQYPQHRRHLRPPDQVRTAEGAAPQVLYRGGKELVEACPRFQLIFPNLMDEMYKYYV